MYGINSYYDIVNYVQDACGEMAYDKYAQDNFPKLFKKANRLGVRDIGGWLADELYNDSDTVNDLAGDMLFELISSKYGEDPMDKAVWSKHIAELNKLMPHVTLG